MPTIPDELPELPAVEIPDDLPKKDYEADERRADIYRRVKEAGRVKRLDKTYVEMGEEYDVSPSTISNDIEIIRRYIVEEELSTSRMRETFANSLEWALDEAMDEGDYSAVPRILKQKKKWLQDIGYEEKSAEKHEVEHKGDVIVDRMRQAYKERDED